MHVQSFLVQGAATSAIASHLGTLPESLDALVLLGLGQDLERIAKDVQSQKLSCPVYMTDTYGILGPDIDDDMRNIELMEKGHGSEYGFCGGSGGEGCLVLGYSGGAIGGTDEDPLHWGGDQFH